MPDSPEINTGARVVDTDPICFQISRICRLLPRMSPASALLTPSSTSCARDSRLARCGLDHRAQPIDIDRLDQVLVRAELDRAHGRLHVIARGDDHDGWLVRALCNRGDHVEPGTAGQAEIEQHEVRTDRRFDRTRCVVCGRYLVALPDQELFERAPDRAVVVDYQDAAGHSDTRIPWSVPAQLPEIARTGVGDSNETLPSIGSDSYVPI